MPAGHGGVLPQEFLYGVFLHIFFGSWLKKTPSILKWIGGLCSIKNIILQKLQNGGSEVDIKQNKTLKDSIAELVEKEKNKKHFINPIYKEN